MTIWFLFLWSAYVTEFEGGQYQTYDQCEAAAQVQTISLTGIYGPGKLHWRCERRHVG